MSEKTFYDIHMHAFNLSHPYFRAFINRFNLRLLLAFAPIIAPIVTALVTVITHTPGLRSLLSTKIINMVNRIKNLLSVMENDVGSFFLLLENCLRENGVLDDQGLHIGGETYSKCVLTPLMIDFGYKGFGDTAIHYKEHSRKPIREQVIDVFRGIKDYAEFDYKEKYLKAFPHLAPKQGQNTSRIFEIYPFIGINTKNYEKKEILELLDKYFKEYKHNRKDLAENKGKFDGNIDNLRSNFAAGVKVYPPLDFDPWPEKNDEELKKVTCLYKYCQNKGIPITAHGSTSGFVVLKKGRLKEVTSISKWVEVTSNYPKLKLNLAHFPVSEKLLWLFPKRRRLNEILNLVINRKNVYVDFSYRATSNQYYKSLRKFMDTLPQDSRDILTDRILFGSDFAVNLTSIDSYNEYLTIFSDSSSIIGVNKEKFCFHNPEKFLFSEAS